MIRPLALLLALGLALPPAAAAIHRKTPTLLQVTPITGAGAVQNPSWGGFRHLVFDSDAELVPGGGPGRQVFLFDLGAGTLTQITAGPGDAQRASTGRRGRRIVYDARPGGVGPRQLFLRDTVRDTTTQLTQAASDCQNASMDSAGRVVVFESDADLLQTGTPGTQIYKIDLRRVDPACPYPCAARANQGLTQITDAPGTSRNPVTSRGGGAIAFESDADLLGNGDTEAQIYVYQARRGRLTQVSSGPGASRNPSISRNGRIVAYESDADVLGTGSSGTQIFLHLAKRKAAEQVTSVPGGASTSAAVSSDGRNVTFTSTDDLLGTGSTGPEIFTYVVRRREMHQVTNDDGASTAPSHNSGVFAALVSDGDLLGNGTTGTALYVVNLFALGDHTVPGP